MCKNIKYKSVFYAFLFSIVSFSAFGQKDSSVWTCSYSYYKPPLIFFEPNSYKINFLGKTNLDTIALFASENKNVIFEISGYTDSKGNEKYNIILSKKRAVSVRNYLNSKGIPLTNLKIKYLGETKLANQCTDGVECSEEFHRANRRVELVFVFPEE